MTTLDKLSRQRFENRNGKQRLLKIDLFRVRNLGKGGRVPFPSLWFGPAKLGRTIHPENDPSLLVSDPNIQKSDPSSVRQTTSLTDIVTLNALPP